MLGAYRVVCGRSDRMWELKPVSVLYVCCLNHKAALTRAHTAFQILRFWFFLAMKSAPRATKTHGLNVPERQNGRTTAHLAFRSIKVDVLLHLMHQ
ncbi:hypothetical protein AVEN_231011-1 [Araneus ventricosus]|uniref:Uncharacterized protein n=1 Tax=Araneus ventricosus TaxID=182803 RepID=A0A4Y2A5A0_ARAVE|nr:hypothetical protein AVEN_231011-1 [Araneus ventricosus]